ncbi:Hydantoin racemase [Candidatus Rhodobacter oscarellae]|uniref:Hydantoin racemase n=1 Tax=Candidatus Rhodobacter oscarellae TaxID=1675527 RepID=A0A0J9E7B6_9RHOB|nr:aspartate/glutamate racemase family protein [Candidatus Rhodobacter lobularis]KMW57674.1 Hydantoin racemase [Candidatus Rhodobacter lobularis]
MKPVLLINPNSSDATTEAMLTIARRHLPDDVLGWTNRAAPAMITEPKDSAAAADQVAQADLPKARAVIVAAFGDPGAVRLAQRLSCPVVGIGAAAARAAAAGRARFAVAATTIGLRASIDALMRAYGTEGSYLGSFLTAGDPYDLLADPAALDAALLDACMAARTAGAERIIIGGGPLAEAAIRLAGQVDVPLVQPLPEACKAIAAQLD